MKSPTTHVPLPAPRFPPGRRPAAPGDRQMAAGRPVHRPPDPARRPAPVAPAPRHSPLLPGTAARILAGVIVSGAVIIAGIGFAGSYTAVRELAREKGFGTFSYLFPIGIDAGICVLLALDLLLTWARIPFPLLRQTAWLLTAATIAFNAATAWPDHLAAGMHTVIPVLFVVTVEAARHTTGRIADITADTHMDGVRHIRWVLSPARTFFLWRRMKLWELRSYDQAVKREQERLVYQANLRSRYGRGWRRKAPVEALIPLRLARYGLPLAASTRAGAPTSGTAPAAPRPADTPRPDQAPTLPSSNAVRHAGPGQTAAPTQPATHPPQPASQHARADADTPLQAPPSSGPTVHQPPPDSRPAQHPGTDTENAHRIADAYRAWLTTTAAEPAGPRAVPEPRSWAPKALKPPHAPPPGTQPRHCSNAEDARTSDGTLRDAQLRHQVHSAARPDHAAEVAHQHLPGSLPGSATPLLPEPHARTAQLPDISGSEVPAVPDQTDTDPGRRHAEQHVELPQRPGDHVRPAHRRPPENGPRPSGSRAVSRPQPTPVDRYYQAWADFHDLHHHEPDAEELSAHLAQGGILDRQQQPIKPKALSRYLLQFRCYATWAQHRTATLAPDLDRVTEELTRNGITAQYNRPLHPHHLTPYLPAFEHRWRALNAPDPAA